MEAIQGNRKGGLRGGCKNMATTKKYRLDSWGYLHLALFVTGITTFGFLDGFTAILMMEKRGIGAEVNPMLRDLVLTLGITGFLFFKVLVTTLILSVPFLLYKKGTMQWTKTGFLSAFTVIGAVAAMDNYIFLMSKQVWLEPAVVAGLFLIMIAAVLQFGEIMDSPQLKQVKPFKISDKGWEQMKMEIGYPD